MEFIIVTATGGAGAFDVLVNRVRCGTTGQVIALGAPGHCTVSLAAAGAEERLVDVAGTTPTHPLRIDIRIGAGHAC